jgi:hypothetical protein
VFAGLAFNRFFQEVDRVQARALLGLVIASVPVAFLNMLGILVMKSGFFPRILGILLIDTLLAIILPAIREPISPVPNVLMAIGEIPFLLWLLIRGARNPAGKIASPAAAIHHGRA